MSIRMSTSRSALALLRVLSCAVEISVGHDPVFAPSDEELTIFSFVFSGVQFYSSTWVISCDDNIRKSRCALVERRERI